MIGVFDSGLGGLSVLDAITRQLPHADLLYFADTAHVPYGNKEDGFIRGRVLAIGDELVQQGCHTLVVACNTATVAAIGELRRRHPGIPVVGVEPGVKPAAAASLSRRIAILATESTARSERLQHLIRDHAQGVEVHVEPCPGWATRVEMLQLNAQELAQEVAERIVPLLDRGVDRIVLGCTHYSFLVPAMLPLLGDRAQLVDVAAAVARQVVRQHPPGAGHGSIRLMASARPERLYAALPALGLAHLRERCHSPDS
ncbi:MAG TPA: glutamate racemase [Rhodocyclaceae bacterium]